MFAVRRILLDLATGKSQSEPLTRGSGCLNSLQTMQTEVFEPHGFVKLVDWVGTEVDIVNAARVSFHKEVSELEEADEGLLRFLLKNRHGTPFEQGFQSIWHIRLPIFVMREWVRHRIGHSINEESGRYVELRPDFYVPDCIRQQTGKPGGYTFEPLEREKAHAQFIFSEANESAYAKYVELIDRGVAREQARIVLPTSIYTEMRWTANARSLMHFLGLRNSQDAMYEIRQYAKAIEDIFAIRMPITHREFVGNNRIAP